MDFAYAIAQMEHHARTIRSLTDGVSQEQARWHPAPDAWSILEVINHLYDEEREDFRARLELMLRQSGEEWKRNDPQGWVTSRRYNERHFEESVNNFLLERERAVAWLRALPAPDWSAAYQAPWGSISAGDMFASWVAHDLLHTRQLVELQWAWAVKSLAPYQVEYAGQW